MPSLPRLASIVVAAALLAAAAVASPAQAAPSRDRYAVGDSVMLGARTALKARGFGVDASTSRQAYVGPSLLRKKGAKLPENVVVHLGTNGTFPLDTCKKLVRIAGPERRVFLVTIFVDRTWQAPNNKTIRKCAESFPEGRVTVVDWNAVAKKHPSWFYADHTHLKPTGAKAFARLLDSSVDAVVNNAGSATKATPTSAKSSRDASILGATGTATVGLNG